MTSDSLVRTASPTRAEVLRLRVAATVGAVIAVPILFLLPAALWSTTVYWKPSGPPGLELSTWSLSVYSLMVMAVLFGPLLGAGVGAAWVAGRMGLPHVAGRWCRNCGSITALTVIGCFFLDQDPLLMLWMSLLPWRTGHLLWSLLMMGWGIRKLRTSRSDSPTPSEAGP